MERITKPLELHQWLEDKPLAWSRVIAARIALRALPHFEQPDEREGDNLIRHQMLRATFIAWAASNYPAYDLRAAAIRAARALSDGLSTAATGPSDVSRVEAAITAVYAAEAIFLTNDPNEVPHDKTEAFTASGAAESAAGLAYSFVKAAYSGAPVAAFWENLSHDCDWLARYAAGDSAPVALSREKLWWNGPPTSEIYKWRTATQRMLAIDPNSADWIDWYDRRIRGERAAFHISGDERRKEDKWVLRQLASAADEDFWNRGTEYVNQQLTDWLEEARGRAEGIEPLSQSDAQTKALIEHSLEQFGAPVYVEEDLIGNHEFIQALKIKGTIFVSDMDEIPDGAPFIFSRVPQDSGAIAYGINAEGKLDRLPHSDQQKLRDTLGQRRIYTDLRAVALQLREEGQRLGQSLTSGLNRFVASFPENFEDAETYPVWRDGNALRRLYWAHRRVENGLDPDPARLEPAIAEELGGMLDLFNNFAFGDDGMRAMDERRIPPQERATVEAEAALAEPLVDAVENAPAIATDLARDDFVSDATNLESAEDDPYAAQTLDQANRTKRNFLAGLLDGAKKALANPTELGKTFLLGAIAGAAGVIGKTAISGIAGFEFTPILEFIASNTSILHSYVSVAFSSYPDLHILIDRVFMLWKQMKKS